VAFFLSTDMRVKVERVLLLREESWALPWPPPKPASPPLRREQAAVFRQMGPSSRDDGWGVELTIEFGQASGMVERPLQFLITCNCPFDQIKIMEAEGSPRGAGLLSEPGDQPNNFIITVRPSSLAGYRSIVLLLVAPEMVRVASVHRLTPP
jgi:hypothetical protein